MTVNHVHDTRIHANNDRETIIRVRLRENMVEMSELVVIKAMEEDGKRKMAGLGYGV